MYVLVVSVEQWSTAVTSIIRLEPIAVNCG